MIDRTIIEDQVILHSPKFDRINKEFRKPEVYSRCLKFLKILLSPDVIEPLVRPGEEGIFLFYFHRELRQLFGDLAQRIIKFAGGDESGWIEFSDQFVAKVGNDIIPIIENNAKIYQILEIGMRKLLRREIVLGLAETTDLQQAVVNRTAKLIDGIFHKIRSNLAKKIILRTDLLRESFLKIPLVVGKNDYELLRNLNKHFLEYEIPFSVFYTIFSIKAQQRNEKVLQLIEEYLKEGNYSTKRGLLKGFTYYISKLNEEDVKRMLTIVQQVAEEKTSELENKNKDIKLKLSAVKENIDSFFQQFLKEFRHALMTEQSYEKLQQIVAKINLKMGDFYNHFRESQSDLTSLDKRMHNLTSLKTVNENDFRNWLSTPGVDFPLLLNVALSDHFPQLNGQAVIKELKKVLDSIQKNGDEKEKSLASQFRKGGIFKEKFHTDLMEKRYIKAEKEVVKPIATCILMEEMVEILPKSDRTISLDEVVFISDLVDEKKEVPVSEEAIDKYRKLISLLIYDIRGSTFMGTKLENAEIENEIRTLFNRSMIDVSHKFGGWPIKDTGDGGIILFARNVMNKMNADEEVAESELAAINATQCAVSMLKEAEDFVKKNLKHYRNWFKEAQIRELEFEGGAFAQLPPEYKQIFQIGVGVVSGHSPKEIYFDRNAFGDLDVTGMLVREANLFSKARSPERSMVICDEATVFSIILNSESISFLSPEGSKLNIDMLDIEQAINHWLTMKKKRIGFVHEARSIVFKKLDVRISDCSQLRVGKAGVSFDDFGLLVDERGGRVKFAYEVMKL